MTDSAANKPASNGWKPDTSKPAIQSLKIRVTADGVSDVITIPVKFL